MTEYQFFKMLCENQCCNTDDFTSEKALLNKLFKSLIKKGLGINFDGQIYELVNPIVALDSQKIKNYIQRNSQKIEEDINIIFETKSTNIDVRSFDKESEFAILLAEYQSSGKGRRGNQWLSPLGENIYLSIKFPDLSSHNLSYFPLYISTVLADTFNKFGLQNIQVKWPNDLYINSSKICGLLVERVLAAKKQSAMILGIGINVNMTEEMGKVIGKDISRLKYHLNSKNLDRNEVLAHILPNIIHAIKNYSSIKFDTVKIAWEKYNLLEGKTLLIRQENKQFYAKYIDINDDGSLKVLCENKLLDVYAGDVSIKGWEEQ